MAFEIKRHDRRPFFVAILMDDFDSPNAQIVDLTTATSAVFNMKTQTGGTIIVTRGSASITNPTGGEVTYQWGTADTSTSGAMSGEIEVLWNDGKPETFPGGPTGGPYWDITITDDIA